MLVIDRYDEVEASIGQRIIEYVEFCLCGKYEVIVPVEGEGLAILLPSLRGNTDEEPLVIPSNSMKLDHLFLKEDLIGKRILVCDTSIYSGKSIIETINLIEEKFECKVDYGSIIVHEDFSFSRPNAFPGAVKLPQNLYDLARDEINEYLSEKVLTHYGDPPLWDIKWNESHISALVDKFRKLGTIYQLPTYNRNSNWLKFTIDCIELSSTNNWYPVNFAKSGPHRLRIYWDLRTQTTRVLPLFQPSVPSESPAQITEFVKGAESKFPGSLEGLVAFADEANDSPYQLFRWASAVGSVILLREFIEKLRGIEIVPLEMKIVAPVPNLYNYSCSEEVFQELGRLAQLEIHLVKEQPDNEFSYPSFSFENIGENSLTTIFNSQELTPEEGLISLIGKWLSKMEDDDKDLEGKDDLIAHGLSFVDIQNLAANLPYLYLSRALDTLIDERFLKPIISKNQKGFVEKRYVPSSESTRKYMKHFSALFSAS